MAIKVVNSSPGTIKVSVSETSTVTVSSPDNSVISIEPGITSAERNKLAGIEAGATTDQTLTGGTNINVSESGGDYTINLDNSIDLSGTLDVTGDATLDSDLTVAGDITVSDGGGAILQTQSASDNINVRAQTVKFPGSFGVNISATASAAPATLKSNSGTVSLDGNSVTLTMDGGTSRKTKVYDGNSLFTQDRFVIEGLGTTTLYQASTSDSGAKLFEIKAAGTSPFALEHVQIGPDSGGYKLPAADGSANAFLQTDGSGTVTFVAPTISDLSDSSNVVTLDGTQTITGNKTFSGTTTLGTTISGAIATTGSVSILNSQDLSVTGNLAVTGTSSFGGDASFNADLLASGLKFTGSGTNTIGPSGTGGSQDDLEIQSNGNVTVKLDSDNDESGQKFKVVNNSGSEKFSVDEDGNVEVHAKIISATDRDIDIEPGGAGDVLLGNFKFDADQSVGSGQDNYVLTYDNSTGKISLEEATGGGASALNDLSDVSTSGVSNGDVLVANVSGNFSPSSNLQDLVTMLKSGSTTTLTSVGDGTSTDKGVLNLGASSASLKYNTTGITIDEASPGDIEFIVATDASGSTAFTAVHIDGTTTANAADVIIKNGSNLKIESSSASALLRYTGSGNANITLPSSTGTLALTTDTDLSNDTTPQLGGNLDVNGNDIVSTSNADIELDPNGTGKVVFKGNSDKGAGQFVLNCEQNSHGIVIKGPPHSAGASYTLTLPNTDGSANEVLKTDGSGNLDWVAQTDTNLGSTDQTLSGTRNIDMGSNFLTFKSGSNLRMQYDPNDDRFEFNNGLRVNGSFVTADGGLTSGLVKFNEPTQGGTNGVILRGPSTNLTSDVTFVLPDADGSAGQFLKTDGGGNLSFASAGGSGSTTFLGLTDTPSSFTASKFLKVNSAGNAVEFVDGGDSGISNVVEDTTPQLGGDLDTNGKNVLFAKTANTDHSSNGDIVKIGTGSTTQGELCYYTSSGTWVAADADATGTAGGVLLAIALGTDPDVDGMLLRGMYTLDHDPGTIGDELYVSTTAGDITSTAPSGAGDIVRVVGYCLDSTNGQIWFNPSNDFIELA
jgi:hypothetical protein